MGKLAPRASCTCALPGVGILALDPGKSKRVADAVDTATGDAAFFLPLNARF